MASRTDLISILTDLAALSADETEADTRARVIDPLLRVLGWPQEQIKREPFAGWTDSRGYLDYLLQIRGLPTVVLEAKRSGRTFDFPKSLKHQKQTTFKKLTAIANENLKEAIEQCWRYAVCSGAQYACATNGSEWVFFKPVHPKRVGGLVQAKVILFSGFGDILSRLDDFEMLLSKDCVERGECERLLLGRELKTPIFAKRLRDVYQYTRHPTLEEEDYSAALDQLLRHYVLELTTDDAFRECYVPVKLNRHTATAIDATIDKHAADVRRGRTFGPEGFGQALLAQTQLPGVPGGRTIILHGPIGVGKTSLLRECELRLRDGGRLKDAVWARIDLLPFHDRPFDSSATQQMTSLLSKQLQRAVSDATSDMPGRFDPDQWDHLRDIYNHEVTKFRKGRFPNSNDSDPIFLAAAQEYVWKERDSDPHEHLLRVVRWLTVHCKLPVVLILDNTDQLGLGFQEFVYKLAESFQARTSAIVIIALRTEALASHRLLEHSLAAVNEVYEVQQARLPDVLSRRFAALERLLSSSAAETPQQRVTRERMSVLMDTLRLEAELGSDVFQIVDAIGNGALRESLRAIAAIFRSSPKTMDKLVAAQYQQGEARLFARNAIKALLKEDLWSQEIRPLLPNLYTVDRYVVMPHSLAVRMLQQAMSKTSMGEYTVDELLNDFANAGVIREVAARVLTRLRHDRLISVPHMMQDIQGVDRLSVTALAHVMLNVVIGFPQYYDHYAFETIIYDETDYEVLRRVWSSGDELWRRFVELGNMLFRVVSKSDDALRAECSFEELEPSVSTPLKAPWMSR